jgi:hypothetical protein
MRVRNFDLMAANEISIRNSAILWRPAVMNGNPPQTSSFALRYYPTPSAFSLRCNAERSMPTNSAVREMLPEKRLIWAIR